MGFALDAQSGMAGGSHDGHIVQGINLQKDGMDELAKFHEAVAFVTASRNSGMNLGGTEHNGPANPGNSYAGDRGATQAPSAAV